MKNNRSTYSLILNANSEEKGRSIFETAVYGLVVVCTALSMWQFASGSIVLPSGSSSSPSIAAAPAQKAPAVVRG